MNKYYSCTRSDGKPTIVEVYSDPDREKLECVYFIEDGHVLVYKDLERTILLDALEGASDG